MDLRLYFKKRKVEAESSASIKEGVDREDEENREEDDREEIEILEEDQEARQEIVEIQEEKDGDDGQEETVDILEEEDGDPRQVETVESLEDGNRDEEQEEIEFMEKKDGASAGARKRKVGRLDSSKHLVQYNTKWEREFPWLVPKKDTCKFVGMLCSLCMRHKCTAKYNHSTVWSETPCICLCKDSIRRHSLSLQHKEAVERELCRQHSSRDGGIEQAFQKQAALNKAVIKVAMECLYWLVKSEMPHTSLYGPLVQAVEFMVCDQLHNLKHGENAKYTSRRITQEFLQVMSDQIESVQLKALLSSPYYSIMVDETTDISFVKEMVLYARFISCTDGTIVTSFLKIVELSDGRAETVEEAILTMSGLTLFHCLGWLGLAVIEQLL